MIIIIIYLLLLLFILKIFLHGITKIINVDIIHNTNVILYLIK